MMKLRIPHHPSSRGVLLMGHLFCWVYLIFCALYYLERVLYIDTANQVFSMVNTGWFSIFVERYSMFLHQLLPMLGLWLDASLNTVIFLYAISFGLIMYLIFCINAHVFKSMPAAMLILLMPASMGHTFFHGISETVQLFAFSTLLFGWLDHLLRKERSYHPALMLSISALLLALCFFIHPVSAFFVAYLLAYLMLEQRLYKAWWVYALGGIFGVLLFAKLLSTTGESHDASFFSELGQWRSILPQLADSYPIEYLGVRFWEFYSLPSALLLCSIVVLLWRRKWMLALYLPGFIVAFMLISLIVYHKGDADHGMERSFLPLAFFCGLPFLRELLFAKNEPGTYHPLLTSIFFLGVAAWGFTNIAAAGTLFSNRIQELRYYVGHASSLEGSKYIVPAGDLHLDPLEVNYLFATETLMLSALKGPEGNQTIYINHGEVDSLVLQERDDLFLFTNYHLYRSDAELNPRYFHISGKYAPLFTERSLVYSDFCGSEILDATGTMLQGAEQMQFALNAPRDSSVAYEGQYSIYTGPHAAFGLGATLPPGRVGDQWRLRIKRKGHPEASLVVTDGKGLYVRAQHATHQDDQGWETLELTFIVSSAVEQEHLKLYVWNPSQESTWFDNLELSLWSLQHQP